MRVTIRAAHPEDAKAISRLIREELHQPVSASDTAHTLARLCVSPRHRVFVAAVDDVVVGFLHACDYDSPLLYYSLKHVTALAVAESYRRVGIGTALMQRAERWAAESGAAGIRLESQEMEAEVHPFFGACGYALEQRELRLQKLFEDAK